MIDVTADKIEKPIIAPPELPSEVPQPVKTEKQGMEEFLDDLLG